MTPHTTAAQAVTVLHDVPAPAKLNLFLHVVGRRPDGYHLLQTVFRFVDLADQLDFERRTDGRVTRVTPLEGVPSAQCLTVRAALALQQATGCAFGVDIHLRKRIPQGGGLGGGSSDAASVLLALNRLWRTGLSRRQLLHLALPLGADVPVFVFGNNAFAEGVGEALQPMALPAAWYVVVQPAAEVPTGVVFSHPDLTRNTKPVRITDLPDLPLFGDKKLKDVQKSTPESRLSQGGKPGSDVWNAWQFGHNDLQPVVFQCFPVVRQAWVVASSAVQQVGASGCQVRMSGSGACLFIECASQQQAASIHAAIAATIRSSDVAAQAVRSVTVCAGLSSHPLQHWAL